MKDNLFSNKSFKVRAKVSVCIVTIAILGALTPYAIGLRIVYSLAAIISALEINALMAHQPKISFGLSLASLLVLIASVSCVVILPRPLVISGIILTMISDSGAYMVGKICGTKFIHTRPFLTISPNKSWEGIIGGIIAPGLITPILNCLFLYELPGNRPMPIAMGCLAGLCAIIGDTSESALKRSCGAKDANDVLKSQSGFRRIEALLGGSEGHGGYYDRLDSMSVVLAAWGAAIVLFYAFSVN